MLVVVTPANDTMAPAIFATPRRLLTFTISILNTSQINPQ
jgi:hypothetical protein